MARKGEGGKHQGNGKKSRRVEGGEESGRRGTVKGGKCKAREKREKGQGQERLLYEKGRSMGRGGGGKQRRKRRKKKRKGRKKREKKKRRRRDKRKEKRRGKGGRKREQRKKERQGGQRKGRLQSLLQ
ncbi:hypothetical protein, partial [Staphylococcus aureus]|uniref:hypothetical protein n=1 Tax=Staphylococcus aureus TaxID=1280 RepID=UPI0019A8F371